VEVRIEDPQEQGMPQSGGRVKVFLTKRPERKVAMRTLRKTAALGVIAALALTLLMAGTAAARPAPPAYITLNAGQTVNFGYMTVAAPNAVHYGLMTYSTTDFSGDPADQWGNLAAYAVNEPWSYTNNTGSTAYVVFYVQETVGSSATYRSDSTSYNTQGSWDHATVGYSKGKIMVSINATEGGAYTEADYPPALGAGDFNVTYKVSKR
jgi:hypothetical protein